MENVSVLDELGKCNLQCTGCSACKNICPTDAINMEEDQYGFLYPVINSSVCVNCCKCLNTCPVLKKDIVSGFHPQSCFAIQAEDDIRSKSSSGGAFTIFAEEILSENGIVCGAFMDENLYTSHICISNPADLHKLQKSKYVQSDIGYIYREIKETINKGKYALFCGTPCQIAGLYAFFEKKPDKLITIDLICHGVPSQKMLRDSLKEKFADKKVVKVDFRDKNYGWECLSMTVTLENQTKRRLSYDESRYEQGFHPNMTLRESCFSCEFCEFPRKSDLTIGDFWNIWDYDTSLGDQKGTSAVIVNSLEGKHLFEKVRERFVKCQEFPMGALNNNRITKSITRDASREYFLELYKKRDFNQAVYFAQQRKYDIGIVGNWSYPNYGSALTYYALYKILKKMGYAVGMVSWPNSSEWKPYNKQELFLENPYKEYEIMPIPEKREDLFEMGKKCDIFILGSDQLLNNNLYRWFDKFILMDWVPSYKHKIAYAASFGCDFVWGEENDHAEMAHFFQQYDAFSVREETGRKILKEIYGVEAQTVLDPIFLMDNNELHLMAEIGKKRTPKEKYMFVYILDPSKEKAEVLNNCSYELNLVPYSVTDAAPEEHGLESFWDIKTECNVKLEEWVSYIKNAEFVITDSFHGMCVSILLKKNFFAIINYSRGETRFIEIAKKLGLESRLISSIYELPQKMQLMKTDIDYCRVEKELQLSIRNSFAWLSEALKVKKQVKTVNEYDILSSKVNMVYGDFEKEKNKLEALILENEQQKQKLLELEKQTLKYKIKYFLKRLRNFV